MTNTEPRRRPTLAGITCAIIAVIFATVIAIIILVHTAQPTWPSFAPSNVPTTAVFEQAPPTPNDLASEDTTDDVPMANTASLAAECQGRHGMITPTWNPNVRLDCDQPTKP